MAKQDMKQNDSLFLLEVLIDKIVFAKSPCFSDKDFRTCVLIECPTVDPIEICDDDPSACCSKNLGPFVKNFNNGKSCLFSLNESDINRAMSKFPIKVSVSKALPCGCHPTKINMGEATIDMTKEFVEARKQFLEDQNNVSYQALKDSFRLVSQDASETGEIVMFLRISCFGKHITTRFQGTAGISSIGVSGRSSMADRSYFPRIQSPEAESPKSGRAAYSHMGSYPIYNVTTTKGARTPTKDKDNHEEAPKPAPQDGVKQHHHECASGSHLCGAQFGSCPTAKDPYNSRPCENPDDPCYCSGPKPPGKQQMACRNTDLYCLHVPKGRSKQFEEIGTTLGGNELKIKVPASASIIKKISQTHVAMQVPFTKGTQDGPCAPPCGKNQISLALPSEATCCQGAQLAGTQFSCTTEGCTQISKHAQQLGLARGDIKTQEVVNRDSFVLRVAKTALQGDRKCKLEMELVTPKGPDKKLPVQKNNIRIQSDNCECCGVRRIKRQKPIKPRRKTCFCS